MTLSFLNVVSLGAGDSAAVGKNRLFVLRTVVWCWSARAGGGSRSRGPCCLCACAEFHVVCVCLCAVLTLVLQKLPIVSLSCSSPLHHHRFHVACIIWSHHC